MPRTAVKRQGDLLQRVYSEAETRAQLSNDADSGSIDPQHLPPLPPPPIFLIYLGVRTVHALNIGRP